MRYEKLSDFTLKSSFHLTLLSDEELDKSVPNIPDFQDHICDNTGRHDLLI